MIGCWTYCHCLYLQCHDSLQLQDDELGTVVEGLYCCINMGQYGVLDGRVQIPRHRIAGSHGQNSFTVYILFCNKELRSPQTWPLEGNGLIVVHRTHPNQRKPKGVSTKGKVLQVSVLEWCGFWELGCPKAFKDPCLQSSSDVFDFISTISDQISIFITKGVVLYLTLTLSPL